MANPRAVAMQKLRDKQKYTVTETIDKNGLTTIEKNENENGIVTETKRKTPSSFFETAANLVGISSAMAADDITNVDLTNDSLLTLAPEGVYQSDYFDNVDGYYGDLINGRPIDPKQMRASGMPPEFIESGSYFGGQVRNPVYDAWIASGKGVEDLVNPTYMSAPGQKNLIEDAETFPNTTEGDLNAAILATPQANVESVLKALEKDIDTPVTAENFQAELKRQNTLKNISADNMSPLFDAKGRLAESAPVGETATRAASLFDDQTFMSENMDLTFESVEDEATKDLKDSEEKDMVVDAITEIKNTNPEGIKVLNEFASWADTVSDDVAIREAENYLLSLKQSPSVDERFRKAMAIGMMSMLFGDDFTTAMNTGFGVVADDYAEEAAEQKAITDAEIALQKKLSEENRALNKKLGEEERALQKKLAQEERDFYKKVAEEERGYEKQVMLADHNSLRDYYESLNKDEFKALLEQPEKDRLATAKRMKDNMGEGNRLMNSIMTTLGEDRSFLPPNIAGEVSGLLQTIENQSPEGFKLDLFNPEHSAALSGVLNNYATEMKFMKGKAAPAAAYAQQFFIQNELQEFTDSFATIPAELIAPDRATLTGRPSVGKPNDDGQRKQIYVANDQNAGPLLKTGLEETLKLAQKIEQLGSQGLGERGTTILLYKDYLDFQKQSFAADDGNFEKMETLAYQRGVGPFTQFVLVHLSNKLTLDNLGKNFDSVLAKQSQDIDVRALRMYIETGAYDIEQIKSSMK